MNLENKGDVTSVVTMVLSWLSLIMHELNLVTAQYMPLISAFGIISGTVLTAWYYWVQHKHRVEEHRLMVLKMKNDLDIARMKNESSACDVDGLGKERSPEAAEV